MAGCSLADLCFLCRRAFIWVAAFPLTHRVEDYFGNRRITEILRKGRNAIDELFRALVIECGE